MAKFVYCPGRQMMVSKDDPSQPMLTEEERARPIQTPRVFSDLAGYQSPIDGSWIEGRRARKYDMEKNNCVDANDLAPSQPRKLKNARFAKKRGLEHLLE